MPPSTSSEPPSPSSPHPVNGYRPSFDSDSDSSSKDTLVSPPSDPYSLYSDNPSLNADLHLQPSLKEKKSARRLYYDYGITASSLSDAFLSSKCEDSQVVEIHSPHPHFVSQSSYSFPWELPSPSTTRTPIPHRVNAHSSDLRTESPPFYHSQPFWLALYFCFNLGLTLYNKAVLIHFPYAYALTALHALCGSIGGFTLLRLGVYVPAKLTKADNAALFAFSLLYTINIAVSNLSLELVTIPVSPANHCLLSSSDINAVSPSFTRSSEQPPQYSLFSSPCFSSVLGAAGKNSLRSFLSSPALASRMSFIGSRKRYI